MSKEVKTTVKCDRCKHKMLLTHSTARVADIFYVLSFAALYPPSENPRVDHMSFDKDLCPACLDKEVDDLPNKIRKAAKDSFDVCITVKLEEVEEDDD